MNKEVLVKRKRQYGWGVVIFTLAAYVIGRSGAYAFEHGGVDNISAVVLVLLSAVFSIAPIYFLVMWFSDWQKLKKISEPREEHGERIFERKSSETDTVALRYSESMSKKVLVVVLVLGVTVFIYFEYVRITCNEKARIFANKGQLTVSAMKTAYDGQYQICIRGKGF